MPTDTTGPQTADSTAGGTPSPPASPAVSRRRVLGMSGAIVAGAAATVVGTSEVAAAPAATSTGAAAGAPMAAAVDPGTPADWAFAAGVATPQATSVDYREKWMALARSAGTDPASQFTFLGGDVIDVVSLPNQSGGVHIWLGEDWITGPVGTRIEADDTYSGAPVLPIRNGAALETSSGSLQQQLYSFATSGPPMWLHPTHDGGLPPDKVWWPAGGVSLSGLASGTVISAFQLGGGGPADPDYGFETSVLISLNGFLGYQSRVELPWGTDFALGSLRHVPDENRIYGTAGDYSGGFPVPPTTIDGWRQLEPTGRKVARVAAGSLTTPSAWQFWDGEAWQPNPADSVAMVDTGGDIVRGMSGNPLRLGPGRWLTVTRLRVTDPWLDCWRADAIQGPWEHYARVPIPMYDNGAAQPTRVGGQYQQGAWQVSHYATILPHLAPIAPAGHQVAMLSNTVVGTPVEDDRPFGTYVPSFVVIPDH